MKNNTCAPPGKSDIAPRLIRIDLRDRPDGTTLAVSPSGRTYHIRADVASVHSVLHACDGTTSIEQILACSPDSAGYAEVIKALIEDGCIRTAAPIPAESDWIRFAAESPDPAAVEQARVLLLGDESLISLALEHALLRQMRSVEIVTIDALESELAAREGEPLVVIALRERFDRDFLLGLDDRCAAHGIRWTQFHIEDGRGWLGPAVEPRVTPGYRDLLGRRLTTAGSIQVFEALTGTITIGRSYLPPAMELNWMLSIFLIDVERWLSGVRAQMLWHELEADPVALTLAAHPVLPLPDRRVQGEPPGVDGDRIHMLVDGRTGVITSVEQLELHPSIPSHLTAMISTGAKVSRLYVWTNNDICGGSSFSDPEEARGAALGEAVERYCDNWTPMTVFRKAPYEQLAAQGEYAIDPTRLVLYSDSQYAAPGFPFVPFTRDLQVYWTPGRSLTRDTEAWIPASLVFCNWYDGPNGDAPHTNTFPYSGVAAGPTLERALVSAIEELIERHATMIWWHNAQPLPAVRPTAAMQTLWDGAPTELGQGAWLIHLDNEFGIPVMAGVLENSQDKLFTIGFATRPDPVEAGLKAWVEACTLQEVSRDLLNPNGVYWTLGAEDSASGAGRIPLKPWREDRAYLDDYRSDFHDVIDLFNQGQIFLDPRAREIVRPWTDVPTSRRMEDLSGLPDRSLETYQRRLEDRGYEIFFAEITTPDVAHTGMHVVRVVVPGLIGNFPAAFPLLGQGKLQNVAVELGWRDTPLREDELNYFPVPHS